MPAKNIYHDGVIQALIADGWTITHDPLTLSYGGKDLFVDLGAEREAIAAEKAGQCIAVEIQSFLGASPVPIFRKQLVNTKCIGQCWRRLTLTAWSTSLFPVACRKAFCQKGLVNSLSTA